MGDYLLLRFFPKKLAFFPDTPIHPYAETHLKEDGVLSQFPPFPVSQVFPRIVAFHYARSIPEHVNAEFQIPGSRFQDL